MTASESWESMHRSTDCQWRGTRPSAPANSPTGFAGTADDEEVWFNWTDAPNALVYNIYSSNTSGGPYTLVQADSGVYLNNASTVGLTNGQTYYFVVSALAETGLSSVYSPEIAVTPTAQGTTYEAENANFSSGAFIVGGCTLCSGGARVGSFVQGVSISFSVNVAQAGTYAVRIYEVNGNQPGDWNLPQEPTIDVTVNTGTPIVTPPLPFTGNWNTPGYFIMNLPLVAGANTIVLSVPADAPTGAPDIDRILVPSQPNP